VNAGELFNRAWPAQTTRYKAHSGSSSWVLEKSDEFIVVLIPGKVKPGGAKEFYHIHVFKEQEYHFIVHMTIKNRNKSTPVSAKALSQGQTGTRTVERVNDAASSLVVESTGI